MNVNAGNKIEINFSEQTPKFYYEELQSLNNISTTSKDDFIDNVDRSDRYTKLVSLLERCDNFYILSRLEL